MSKSREIVLGDGTSIPILYEDRNILAIDTRQLWQILVVTLGVLVLPGHVARMDSFGNILMEVPR